MDNSNAGIETQLHHLQKSARTTRRLAFSGWLVAAGLTLVGFTRTTPIEEIRTKRLIVVDDQDRPRVTIGQDPVDTQRRSRAAGIVILDTTGVERAGFGTMADGTVGLGLDAPTGVGAPMRDRIGMTVGPDGAAEIMIIDNMTRVVTKLQSDSAGIGGLYVYKYDIPARQVQIKRKDFDGEHVSSRAF